eukprot:CAMPEP_0202817700 /NCGR_PEP_ID=MMETSP1389-20130828/7841_1 /ASSEMBLY_ACC=CAM_ASM_000865 /TAXON_ID=302021 /ORGANISM="Rhodomonas sp., Strain CCMP768" /LENGTH=60 /DNA_ID=CAMNT_0049489959 /DNA_START=42 /DNA_END=222 /DNA_ORIENTATION=+
MEEVHRQDAVEVEEEEAKAPSAKEEENEGAVQVDSMEQQEFSDNIKWRLQKQKRDDDEIA